MMRLSWQDSDVAYLHTSPVAQAAWALGLQVISRLWWWGRDVAYLPDNAISPCGMGHLGYRSCRGCGVGADEAATNEGCGGSCHELESASGLNTVTRHMHRLSTCFQTLRLIWLTHG